jgi:hypothetical protein
MSIIRDKIEELELLLSDAQEHNKYSKCIELEAQIAVLEELEKELPTVQQEIGRYIQYAFDNEGDFIFRFTGEASGELEVCRIALVRTQVQYRADGDWSHITTISTTDFFEWVDNG